MHDHAAAVVSSYRQSYCGNPSAAYLTPLLPRTPDDCPEDAAALIVACMSPAPEDRPNATGDPCLWSTFVASLSVPFTSYAGQGHAAHLCSEVMFLLYLYWLCPVGSGNLLCTSDLGCGACRGGAAAGGNAIGSSFANKFSWDITACLERAAAVCGKWLVPACSAIPAQFKWIAFLSKRLVPITAV